MQKTDNQLPTMIQTGYTDHERYAIEATRANRLERENAALRSAMDDMRTRDLRNLDELTDTYTALRIQHDDALKAVDFWKTAAADWERSVGMADRSIELRNAWINNRDREIQSLRDTIAGLLTHDAVGKPCEVCEGHGRIGGEFSVHEDYAGRVPAETVCPEEGCYSGRCER